MLSMRGVDTVQYANIATKFTVISNRSVLE